MAFAWKSFETDMVRGAFQAERESKLLNFVAVTGADEDNILTKVQTNI